MSRCFLGFHGTTKDAAIDILKTNYFLFSDSEDEWLGKGIYFFEDDIKQAYYFCTKARCYSSWAILKSDIVAEVVVDLLRLDDLEEFNNLAKRLNSRYKKTKDGKDRKFIDSVVLETMFKSSPFDVVRGIFDVPKGQTVPRTRVTPYQIQLCVRNRNCIKTIMEVK